MLAHQKTNPTVTSSATFIPLWMLCLDAATTLFMPQPFSFGFELLFSINKSATGPTFIINDRLAVFTRVDSRQVSLAAGSVTHYILFFAPLEYFQL
jgi:hypothetical protein